MRTLVVRLKRGILGCVYMGKVLLYCSAYAALDEVHILIMIVSDNYECLLLVSQSSSIKQQLTWAQLQKRTTNHRHFVNLYLWA